MRRVAVLLTLLALGDASAQDAAPPAAEAPAPAFSLPRGRHLCGLAASPDGKWVATASALLGKGGARSDGRLHLLPVEGGVPTSVGASEFTEDLTFSSDSQWVVAGAHRTRAVEARRLGDLTRPLRIDVSKPTAKAKAGDVRLTRVVPAGGPRVLLVGWSIDDFEERLAPHQLRRIFDLDAGKTVEDLPGRSGDYDWCPSPDGVTAAVVVERGLEMRRATGDVVWTVRTGGYCDGTVFSRDGSVVATHDRGVLVPGRRGAAARTVFLRASDGQVLGSVAPRLNGTQCAAPVGRSAFAVPDDAGVRFVAPDGSTLQVEALPGGWPGDLVPLADGSGVWASSKVGEDSKKVWSVHRIVAPAEAPLPPTEAPGPPK